MMLMKSTLGMVIGLVVVLAGMRAEGQEPPKLVAVPDNPRLETVAERYPNGNIKVERDVVQDEAGNYVNHGTYRMYDLDGEVLKTGEFQNGKQQGRWVQNIAEDEGHLFAGAPQKEFEGPFVSAATFVDGKLHGTWTITDRYGQNIVEWSFSHGACNGKWTWWHSNGQVWLEADYENGVFNGELLERDPNGEVVTRSTYIEGRHLAKDVKWFALGQKQFEGAYLRVQTVPQPVYDWWKGTSTPPSAAPTGKDQRHGVWVAWYRNGNKKTEGTYDHDVPTGKFAWWFENGQKQAEGEYGAGLKSGTWTTWHPNGLRESQVAHVNGKRIGTWMRWDAEGKLVGMRDFNIADSENVTKKSATKKSVTKKSVTNNRANTTQRPTPAVRSRR